MKHRMAVLLVAGVLALSALGCVCGRIPFPIGVVRGSGDVVSETREIGNVSEVDLQSFGSVHIDLGERESLRVEAQDNLLPYIETDTSGGILEIKHRRGTRLMNTQPIDYYLTVRDLEGITVSGAGGVEAPDLQAERFAVKLSGAGGVQIESLQADTLDVTISGAGGLSIGGGAVGNQEVVITGAGDYRARELESHEATVQLSGLGSATVYALDRLDVTISGAGSVQYAGDPEVEQQVTGVGSVRRLGE